MSWAHDEERPRCVTRELPGADEGVRRRVRDHLYEGTREIHSGCWAASLDNLAHTAGCHGVHNADEDGDDGGGSSEV